MSILTVKINLFCFKNPVVGVKPIALKFIKIGTLDPIKVPPFPW
jgi:hypothetical protein